MRRRFLRSLVIAAAVASSAKYLGCDSSRTSGAFVDTDGDGLSDIDERAVYGTSPVLADTDGDGKSDRDEIVLHAFDPTNAPLRFNPRVADLPMLEVQVVSAPRVVIALTESTGEVRTFGETRTFQESVGVTFGTTTSYSRGLTFGDTLTDLTSQTRTVSRTVAEAAQRSPAARDGGSEIARDGGSEVARDAGTVSAPADDRPGPVTVTITDGVSSATLDSTSRAVSRSTSTQVSLSFSEQESRQVLRAVQLAEQYSENHQVTALGGSLRLLVVLFNRGDLAFRVTNLELAASLLSAEGVEAPVGNLHIDMQPLTMYQPYSLAPGEQAGPVNFVRELLSLQTVTALLRDLSKVVLRLGVYELTDSTGRPYAFDTTTVGARTAALTIDYGGRRPPERHLVATNLDPARLGVSAMRALEEILRIPIQCPPDVGLSSVRDVGAVDGGGGRWSMIHRHSDGSDVVTTTYRADVAPYDCDHVMLRAGDVLRLVWEP